MCLDSFRSGFLGKAVQFGDRLCITSIGCQALRTGDFMAMAVDFKKADANFSAEGFLAANGIDGIEGVSPASGSGGNDGGGNGGSGQSGGGCSGQSRGKKPADLWDESHEILHMRSKLNKEFYTLQDRVDTLTSDMLVAVSDSEELVKSDRAVFEERMILLKSRQTALLAVQGEEDQLRKYKAAAVAVNKKEKPGLSERFPIPEPFFSNLITVTEARSKISTITGKTSDELVKDSENWRMTCYTP